MFEKAHKAGFESLDLMIKKFKKEKLLWFVGETKDGRFRSSRNLRAWEF